MTTVLAWLVLAVLAAGVVALNVHTRRAQQARKARGEPEPDIEANIW